MMRGAAFGLLAAALFGISAPIAKQLLGTIAPQLLAGLLYLGAGVALTVFRAVRPGTREARIQRRDWPALAGVIVAGGIVGPVLLLVGLDRVSAVAASLLLNLEAPFTIGLAVLVFGEHIGRYGLVAAALTLGGAALLKLEVGPVSVDGWGTLAIALACFAWAIDNNLTQRLSWSDPIALVRLKTLAAGSVNFALALLIAPVLPDARDAAIALSLGAVSYGLSVVLDAYALRLVGAAREALYFATAPFVGVLVATQFFGATLRSLDVAAMLMMALGVAALAIERHSHAHRHEPLEHDHVHTHDAHHQHEHPTGVPTGEPHAHPHKHEPLVHEHPHTPDMHHRHRH